MRKAKLTITLMLCVALILSLGMTASAAVSVRNVFGEAHVYNSNNGQEHTNLARIEGATFTGNSWATGENRGLDCLNNGVLQPYSGESEGWIISYEYIAANCPNGEPINLTLVFPAPQAVSTVALYASFEHLGYGMPGRFQIIGVLEDDSETVLYDHSQYEYTCLATNDNAHRFNFPLTTVKAITLRCLEPATGCDGKAMPDANCAYWLTEFMAMDDVTDMPFAVDLTATDNLAFLASVQSNATMYCWDRPVTDLTDGAQQSPYWGAFLLFHSHVEALKNEKGLNPNAFFQWGEPVTFTTIEVIGRESSENGGVMKDFRLVATGADGNATTIYDTEKAEEYPDVQITEAGENQPLVITFPEVTAAKLEIEMWGWTPSGDGNVAMWMNEVSIHN